MVLTPTKASESRRHAHRGQQIEASSDTGGCMSALRHISDDYLKRKHPLPILAQLIFFGPLARFNEAMLAYYGRKVQYDCIIGPRAIVIPASLCKMKARDGSTVLAEICT